MVSVSPPRAGSSDTVPTVATKRSASSGAPAGDLDGRLDVEDDRRDAHGRPVARPGGEPVPGDRYVGPRSTGVQGGEQPGGAGAVAALGSRHPVPGEGPGEIAVVEAAGSQQRLGERHRHRRVVAVAQGAGRFVGEDEGELAGGHHTAVAFEGHAQHVADEDAEQRPAVARDVEHVPIVSPLPRPGG